MNCLDLVKLSAIMECTSGAAEVVLGVIDGHFTTNTPDFLMEYPGHPSEPPHRV